MASPERPKWNQAQIDQAYAVIHRHKGTLEASSLDEQRAAGIALRPLIREMGQQAFGLGPGASHLFTGWFSLELAIKTIQTQSGMSNKQADGMRDQYTFTMNRLATASETPVFAKNYLGAIRHAAQEAVKIFYDSDQSPTEVDLDLESGLLVQAATPVRPFIAFLNKAAMLGNSSLMDSFGVN